MAKRHKTQKLITCDLMLDKDIYFDGKSNIQMEPFFRAPIDLEGKDVISFIPFTGIVVEIMRAEVVIWKNEDL